MKAIFSDGGPNPQPDLYVRIGSTVEPNLGCERPSGQRQTNQASEGFFVQLMFLHRTLQGCTVQEKCVAKF